MKISQRICLVVLISSLLAAQSNPPDAASDHSQDGSAIKTLLDAVAKQQKAMNDQQQAMADQQRTLAEQQRQIAEQQKEIDTLKRLLATQLPALSTGNDNSAPKLQNTALTAGSAVDAAAASASDTSTDQTDQKESPLSFRIGGADFTPGGFLDVTAFWRSTNVGSGYGTNFFSIPFANTIPGQITETRITAENSRLSLKAADAFKGNNVTGYVEVDFHGNDPGNLNVTSNSSTLRLRQYWVNVKRGNWEILGGQAWSWLTPNRVGMSPLPSDVFYSLNMDANYQVGLTWTRAPQIRGAFHPNQHWGLGIALENPDQFIGQTNQITFPAAFNVPAVTAQFDAANQTTTPNVHPDIIPKIVYDTDAGGRHFHVEAAGVVTTFRVLPVLNGSTNSKTGGGVMGAVNLELFKNFRFVANAFYSDGGGRYIFGSGPDAVLKPDGTLSLVHSAAGLGGFEWQATPHHLLAAYYGGNYFTRNFFLDTSAGAKPNTFVGFGGPNSSGAANRSIQEPSLVWIFTFWKEPQYGALQLITQGSYLTRSPWFVAPGAPKNARSTMVWADIRYVLP
jgi:hypothetical protein